MRLRSISPTRTFFRKRGAGVLNEAFAPRCSAQLVRKTQHLAPGIGDRRSRRAMGHPKIGMMGMGVSRELRRRGGAFKQVEAFGHDAGNHFGSHTARGKLRPTASSRPVRATLATFIYPCREASLTGGRRFRFDIRRGPVLRLREGFGPASRCKSPAWRVRRCGQCVPCRWADALGRASALR